VIVPGSIDANDPGVAQAKRWYWQRISAMVLALFVLVHLAVMVYAVRGGLSAAEILGRTHGSWAFGSFYAVFVIAWPTSRASGGAWVSAPRAGFPWLLRCCCW
jgi:succinate dehydrogenase hydrophobic anchor subunit